MTTDGNETARENIEKVIIVLCCVCDKRRGTDGAWRQHGDIPARSETVVHSHGICPDCTRVLYGNQPEFGGGKNSRHEA